MPAGLITWLIITLYLILSGLLTGLSSGLLIRSFAGLFAGLMAKLVAGFLTGLIAGFIAIHPIFPASTALAQELDVPYYTTEPEVVEGMMDMARVGPGDYLIDLGSGDGRIVIAAAQRGAVGHGVDLDPERIVESEVNAEKAGVADRVMFLEENLFDTDFSQATVVTMFLLSAVNLRLRPDLLAKLQPGTRVLSHTFDMDDWEPDERQTIGRRPVYLWIIPADASGKWVWKRDDGRIAPERIAPERTKYENRNPTETEGAGRITMSISQRFQMIDVAISAGGRTLTTQEATLRGDRITLIIQDEQNGTRYVCSGTIDGDFITGSLQLHDEDGRIFKTWTVKRE